MDIAFSDYLRDQGLSDRAVRLQQVNSAYGNTLYDVSALHIMHFFLWSQLNAQGKGRFQTEGGNQRLPEGMYALLKGDVLLNTPVRAIEGCGRRVVVHTDDDRRFSAKRVVCTLPFSVLQRVTIDPPLTGLQREAVATLPYYKTYQIHYAIDQHFWEHDGLPPNMWTDSPAGRVNLLRDNTGDPACYLAYINGLQAEWLDRMAPAAAERFLRATIERLRPAARDQLRPLRVHSNQRDPWIGGSYAYWKPGMPLRLPAAMSAQHAGIHFAGEHTALVARGMEGAMESAERVALETLLTL